MTVFCELFDRLTAICMAKNNLARGFCVELRFMTRSILGSQSQGVFLAYPEATDRRYQFLRTPLP